MSQFEEFAKTARSLARNPLGIIALFIVLLYAIAGLVLGVSASKLESSERLPLIWFIVIFPVIVLGVFGWLVSRHHKKLYAPSDFKSDDAFLGTLSPEGQRQRLDKEVAALTTSSTNALEGKQLTNEEIAVTTQTISRIRADVVLAEDLVLRQLEAEYGSPVARQVKLEVGDEKIPFDGLISLKGGIVAIEVKLITETAVRKNLHNILADISYLANRLGGLNLVVSISLLVAIVSKDLSNASHHLIENRFNTMIKGAPIPVELRFFDFANLQERFGITSSA
ncbi:MAG TPA: hypothetical protein VGC66_08965 [Pyrinomonadaceae bacterium]|jgi:hypothetical protein